ncbi:hypothetical protein nbrc107696_35190 [Gordonia spumicola]|uniref:DUF4236 domain-containing protein n=1 Tax=Gordonia spumicola TaxID=589161 RepID=A0A7I9VDA2_9ACTN|nr:DUF4236 domain-containing protein [Gordonia spumicola]GEE03073.1 hypothetical protein nbrc107696_35190 [Gordonia spumicola]
MSFGFRVGVPGMRVRVSTRGVRTSIGPRAARVHVGSGRTGFSTGFGPFYAYQSVGRGRPRSRSRSSRPTAAQIQRSIRAAEREQQIAQRNAEIARLLQYRTASVSAHLERFPPAECPVVQPPPPVAVDAVRDEARRLRLASIPILDRSARTDAKRQADIDAADYCADESARLDQVFHRLVDGAGDWWAALTANDEATVCEAVNAAFADNAAAGCIVGVDGADGSIIMRQPDLDSLPDRMPGTTAVGNPTLRALTKRDRLAWWYDILLSNVAATLLEGFATAPALARLHLAVITRLPGDRTLGVVMFGTWTRPDVERVSWTTTADAVRVLDIASDLSSAIRTTPSGNLSASFKKLSSTAVPGLDDLLRTADVEDDDDVVGLDEAAHGAAGVQAGSSDGDPFALRPFAEWAAQSSSTGKTREQVYAEELVVPEAAAGTVRRLDDADASHLYVSIAGAPDVDVDVIVGEGAPYAGVGVGRLAGSAPSAEFRLHDLPPTVDRIRVVLCGVHLRGETIGYVAAPNGHLQAWRLPTTLDGDIVIAEFRRQVSTWWAKTDATALDA